MKTIKVSEVTPRQLDWLVAKCERYQQRTKDLGTFHVPHYSTDWFRGGPIIEREKFQIYPSCNVGWCSSPSNGLKQYFGPTPLIAAMRCYVSSRLGDTVEVPDKLS